MGVGRWRWIGLNALFIGFISKVRCAVFGVWDIYSLVIPIPICEWIYECRLNYFFDTFRFRLDNDVGVSAE
jgi:hypothetical protein